jgi:hypothetical protein
MGGRFIGAKIIAFGIINNFYVLLQVSWKYVRFLLGGMAGGCPIRNFL